MDKINTRHRTPLDQVNFWFVIMIMQNENKERGLVLYRLLLCTVYPKR